MTFSEEHDTTCSRGWLRVRRHQRFSNQQDRNQSHLRALFCAALHVTGALSGHKSAALETTTNQPCELIIDTPQYTQLSPTMSAESVFTEANRCGSETKPLLFAIQDTS